MKQHSVEFEQEINLIGRQQDVRITYNIENKIEDEIEIETITLTGEQINSATPTFDANLCKSVMKELTLDSNVDIPLGTEINFEWGLLVNDNYEYLDYGKYIVFSSEKKEDTLSYEIICYDKMLYSMKDYEHLDLVYPVTLKVYLSSMLQQIGLGLLPGDFKNQDMMIDRDFFEGINFTYRDALDDIAEATGSVICIEEDNLVKVKYINETDVVLDESSFKDTNVNFTGEKYGPINSVVLSRANADNVYLRDEDSITLNGLCEVKIVDNQLMNDYNRSEWLPELLEALDGIEYYLNDFSSTGIMYLDLLDRYTVNIGENQYSCVMFHDEQNITQGLEENIYTEMPEVAETDYTKADKTDQRINQTSLMVDKQNQQIEALITSNNDIVQKTSTLTQRVDKIEGEIGEIADVTFTAEGYGSLEADQVNESEPILLRIRPVTYDITPLKPSATLTPSARLVPHSRQIYFEKINLKEDEEPYKVNYNIPDDLLFYNNGITTKYDEFVLDYANQQCYIIKRVGIDEDGNKYFLDMEENVPYDYPTIRLVDGDYMISMPSFPTAYIYVRLMAKNIYTSQFATKVELNSKITQTAQEIDLSVDEKLTDYVTDTEMTSAISIKANEINQTVSTKVGKTEVVSTINQSAEQITLSSNRLVVNSTNFKLTKDGAMTCNSATITGGSFNVKASAAGTDTFKITSASDSRDYTYMAPAGFYTYGSRGRAVLTAKSSVSDHSYLILGDGNNQTTLTEDRIQAPHVYNRTTSNIPNMQISSGGVFQRSTDTSSKRYKKDIKDVEDLKLNPNKLYDLEVKQFKYKTDYFNNEKDSRYNTNLIGFIAEDVEKIYPVATDYVEDENGNKIVENWNHRYMIPAMLKLIQEQHKDILILQEKVEYLENKLKEEK